MNNVDYGANFYLLSERLASPEIEGLNLSTFEEPMVPATKLQDFRYELLFFVSCLSGF